MNSQRGNIKQLLAHSPYYQKFSFTKDEYLGLLEVAEKDYAKTSPNNLAGSALAVGAFGYLIGEGFSAIFGPLIAITAIAMASNRYYHAINLKNLIKDKMNKNDYQITRREYIAKTTTGIEKDKEMKKVVRDIWDVIFWCKSTPSIKLRRKNLE